jgi:hypothetical protein
MSPTDRYKNTGKWKERATLDEIMGLIKLLTSNISSIHLRLTALEQKGTESD